MRRDLDLDIREKFFTIGVVKYWHRLAKGEVEAPSLETLEVWLDEALSTYWSCRCPCLSQRSWARWPLKIPSNSSYSN